MPLPDISQIKALSIRQPWCHHILNDGKDVENRSWPTRYRGRVLLHAGKMTEYLPAALADVPRGGIVGMAEITDCVTAMDSKWFFGKYGFVLKNPVALPLIPCRGALGFFTPELLPGLCGLWRAGTLSEGQCCALLNMGRLDFRTACDDFAQEINHDKD